MDLLLSRLGLSERAAALLIVLVSLAGCSSFGPEQLKATYPLYNDAIVESTNQQYLHNLVRLHYRDPVFFLDVANIAATAKLSMNGSVGYHNNSGSAPGNFGAGLGFDMQPTVTYSPLQGEDFVKSMLSPIPIGAVLALTRSGWSVHRIMGLCIESINGVLNAPTASGPTPDLAPNDLSNWKTLEDLIAKVRHRDLIVARENPNTGEAEMQIVSAPGFEETIARIKQILKLAPTLDTYKLKGESGTQFRDTVYIKTRSLGSIFFYLSHRIDTPAIHLKKGMVNVTRTPEGGEFDWADTAAGRLFHIRQSEDKPDNATLVTYYRDHWYYIPDNDLESKTTFLLLTQLFRLQAGAAKGTIPALTIPVR